MIRVSSLSVRPWRAWFLCFCTVTLAPAQIQRYSVQQLQLPSGMQGPILWGLNSSGVAVGVGLPGGFDSVPPAQAFTSTVNGAALVPLPPGWPGVVYPSVVAISNSGVVAGTGLTGVTGPTGPQRQGFVSPVAVGIPGQFTDSQIFGINATSNVVGDARPAPFDAGQATLNSSLLAPIPGGFTFSQARAINAIGQVTGIVYSGGSTSSGFLDGLLLPSIGNWPHLLPMAINAAGQVSGYVSDAGGNTRAFFQGAVIPLPTGATGSFSGPGSLNASGVVVGSTDRGGFVRYPSGDVRLLTDLIDGYGWIIHDGRAVNDSGQIAAMATSADGSISGPVLLTPEGPFVPPPPPRLSAARTGAASGTLASRNWPLVITNAPGSGLARNVQVTITNFGITAGPSCSPQLTSPAEVQIGNLAAGSSSSVGMTINMSDCTSASTRFTFTVTMTANNGTYQTQRTFTNIPR